MASDVAILAAAESNRKWSQQIGVMDGVGVLQLEHPDGRQATHWFDADLFSEVSLHNWHDSRGYAITTRNGEKIRLHWLPTGIAHGVGFSINVDHKNHNTYDSRRSNLRVVPTRENGHNRLDQSKDGACIVLNRPGCYQVRVAFGKYRVFTPGFNSLLSAKECKLRYLEIANECGMGIRPVPTKTELKTISDDIRRLTKLGA